MPLVVDAAPLVVDEPLEEPDTAPFVAVLDPLWEVEPLDSTEFDDEDPLEDPEFALLEEAELVSVEDAELELPEAELDPLVVVVVVVDPLDVDPDPLVDPLVDPVELVEAVF